MGKETHILVSGGGIAGNAVALQLVRAGIRTTVVERAGAPRPGGQAVDLRGASREVAERMGLMPGIRDRQLDERGMVYVDRRGRAYARMPADLFGGNGPVADVEITRGDLNEVLLEALGATGGAADYRYGEWIEALTRHDDGVEVRFASGRVETYDLVVGADGVHSATRRLAFGPEERFSTYLGGYTSYFTVPRPDGLEPGWMTMRPASRAVVGLRPDRDPATAKALVILRVPADPALRGDVVAQQQLLRELLADAGWLAPYILEAMPQAPDFYFDELARVDMPNLSAGRIVLSGDAGYCGSPLSGMGTAMALIGAYVLAGELAAAPSDPETALTRYETVLTPLLEQAKQLPGGGLPMMLPATGIGRLLSRTAARIVCARPLRPLTTRMASGAGDCAVPSYPGDATVSSPAP
ncbi:MAG TPA: FAD-dependent monooxygenase [Nocardia sp.]|uniref:FAD-dependent monooxygenase n=1 Tax=Nocardia sp. TaxID=1821 RepID=UPI002B4ADB85|nr:FAD-dependent monooxygenase [Nocardia sp.]HLS75243.1 FAD-dependent monooxygenase [Nocardia sp.]